MLFPTLNMKFFYPLKHLFSKTCRLRSAPVIAKILIRRRPMLAVGRGVAGREAAVAPTERAIIRLSSATFVESERTSRGSRTLPIWAVVRYQRVAMSESDEQPRGKGPEGGRRELLSGKGGRVRVVTRAPDQVVEWQVHPSARPPTPSAAAVHDASERTGSSERMLLQRLVSVGSFRRGGPQFSDLDRRLLVARIRKYAL